MIKAICFDLVGVYFTPKGVQEFKKNLEEMNISKEKIDAVIFNSNEVDALKTGTLPDEKFWDYVNNSFNLNKNMEEWVELFMKGYEVDPDIEKLVQIIRKNGYKTCICSNNFKSGIQALDNKFHFLSNFDVVVFSYEVGVRKPDKKIFQTLIDKSGVKPEEIVFSDDNPEKLSGAKELGINTFVYENFEQFQKELIKLGVKIN
jgi:putative hydrolase of the HAD superfamily